MCPKRKRKGISVMKHQAAPLLSIGIIFKDDIRCIERCLKALQPLRDAAPCELIMADTGSTDGSREIAEKYADVVFDFPWVDDFSAARNAVVDRASGVWYLSVDTDEYLKEDVSQLVQFLAASGQAKFQAATVVVRNHNRYEMDDIYDDFMALRLVRRSIGVRYEGAVHEHWEFSGHVKVFALSKVIFDHDGYVETCNGSEAGKAKRERNLKLIRETLEKKPNDLMAHMQLIESGWTEPDYLDQVRESVELVKAKTPGWEKAGPPLLRYAVYAADSKKLPELDEWIQLAEEWFPESMYTRLDVAYILISRSWTEQDYPECIQQGNRFLEAMEDYRKGKDLDARMFSTLKTANDSVEQSIKIIVAGAYQCEGQTEQALKLLEEVDCTQLTAKYTSDLLKVVQDIQLKTFADTSSLIVSIWDGISKPEPSQRRADERQKAFVQVAGTALEPKTREEEENLTDLCRNRYTVYRPLRGKCEPGTAAVILEMQDAQELDAALAEVENWNWFSIHALRHALEHGAQFPLPEKPLNIEEMDSLAARLSKAKESMISLACGAVQKDYKANRQVLTWVRSLVMLAVRVFGWNAEDADVEAGMTLARAFAQVEKEFLPFCYTPQLLCRENLFVLSPMHRFGWYCAQAFDALDAGDAAGYVHMLREGLAVCKGVKDMVEFLIDHTPKLQAPQPSAELTALAEQIRTVLSAYLPDNPAVLAIKNSEAYQQVKHLIEGLEVPVVGGLAQ